MKETISHPNPQARHDEDEITLVDHGEAKEDLDSEGSVTLKLRSVRKTDHVNVTRRLLDIERRVKENVPWKLRLAEALKVLEKGICKNYSRRFNRRLTVITLISLCVIVSGIVLFSHKKTETKPEQSGALDTEELQNIRLSPLLITDTGKRVVNSHEIFAGRPFYAEFDVLNWNEQPGRSLDLTIDVRVLSQKGKQEAFRPELVRYSQMTEKAAEKVHVKVFFNFSNEAPAGEYRLSFSVTEKSTQRRAVMETRITIKN